MAESQREMALAMIRRHGRRAGFVALTHAARAWSLGDTKRKSFWRGVAAAIIRLRPPVDIAFDNEADVLLR